MTDEEIVRELARCASTSRWHDDGKITPCIYPAGHSGDHSDGLARWDTAHEYGGVGCANCPPSARDTGKGGTK